MKKIGYLLLLVLFAACKSKPKNTDEVISRTSGKLDLLVDASFDNIVKDQIMVFKSDYPNAEFNVIPGNENKILPTFLNDSVRVIILSRPLTSAEETAYKKRGIRIQTSRFAIDGIALITNKDNPDSTITADDVLAILKGESSGNTNLVFDNAYSSTLRYFKDLGKIKTLPAKGVYTLQNNDDVIKYVAENKNYIGILGVNWLIERNEKTAALLSKVKLMGVKNSKGKKGDDAYYKPTQENLISGVYPFLRNVCIINCEGKNGLGTGFANWLVSQRGQLIVLKSGLGPHQIMSRDFNLKNRN